MNQTEAMKQEKGLEEVRTIFADDRFATENGAMIEAIGDKYAKCSVTITDSHRNAMGAVMGGVYFMLADFAFAVASNNAYKPTVALNVNINFLSSSKGSHLTAIAKCVKDGRTTAVYNVMITDEYGKEVAMFIGTGYKL